MNVAQGCAHDVVELAWTTGPPAAAATEATVAELLMTYVNALHFVEWLNESGAVNGCRLKS